MHAPAGDPFDFHRFRLSTEETLPTLDGGLCGVFGFWFLCLGFGWGFCWRFPVLFWSFSPFNMQCFLSFYDDLGAPPTWRPHSWKNNSVLPPSWGGGCRGHKLALSMRSRRTLSFRGGLVGMAPLGSSLDDLKFSIDAPAVLLTLLYFYPLLM